MSPSSTKKRDEMSKARFEDLELPEEIYPQPYEDELHPLKDEDWLYEVGSHIDTIKRTVGDLQKEINLLTSETLIVKKFAHLKSLLREYGSHTSECKYLAVNTPRFGEEYKLCTCGWCELKSKLRRPR